MDIVNEVILRRVSGVESDRFQVVFDLFVRDMYMDGNKVCWGCILSGGMTSAFIDGLLAAIWFQCHSGWAFLVTDDTSSFEHSE